MERTNALAGLAEELDRVGIELCDDDLDADSKDAIRKAQRIVAELAKCWQPKAKNELVNDYVEAFANCRAIAEEGVNNWRPVTAATLDPERQECLVVEGKEEKDGNR